MLQNFVISLATMGTGLVMATSVNEEEKREAAYDIVLIIVITELIFAFGVGISCILFSFNLVKAVHRENGELEDEAEDSNRPSHRGGDGVEASDGYNTFPPSINSPASTDGARSVTSVGSRDETYSDGSLGEMDEETDRSDELTLLEGVLRNFTDYLRVW